MDQTYGNMSELNSCHCRPVPPQTALKGSKAGLYGALVFVGLICASLLTGVIVLGVYYNNSVNAVTNNDQMPTEAASICPSGWKTFQGKCYFLSSITGPWEAGKQDCRIRGAHLAIINSTEEQEYISSFKDATWIGLNDLEQEGTWKWVDGSPVTLPFWGDGQPDNQGEEDCVHVTSTDGWNDNSCSKFFHWICEKLPLSYFN